MASGGHVEDDSDSSNDACIGGGSGFDRTRRRIIELRVEHRDLDLAIARLAEAGAPDQLQLQRLKKRKLQIKDAITRLEMELVPDIPA
jgi:hypothetical protein